MTLTDIGIELHDLLEAKGLSDEDEFRVACSVASVALEKIPPEKRSDLLNAAMRKLSRQV